MGINELHMHFVIMIVFKLTIILRFFIFLKIFMAMDVQNESLQYFFELQRQRNNN